MSNVFRFCVKSLGVCCPAEYIRLTRRILPHDLAAHLGVSVRTISFWRLKLKRGKIGCEHHHSCPRRPDAQPISLPPQRRIPRRPPAVAVPVSEQSPSPASSPPDDADDIQS